MSDAIIDTARDIMGSPWVYTVLFAIAAIDAFFPAVPSESLVITAGVFAASGEPNLLFVIMAGAAGAFVGDHVSYTIGRTAGSRFRHRIAGGKAESAFGWAEKTLRHRGGLILVVARYIPGGRTAVTVTAGTVEYPLRRFSAFDGVAAISWAAYSGMIGYLGGKAFEENPLLGLAVGLGVAVTITGVVELVRHQRAKRRRRPESSDDDPAQELV